MPFHFSVEGFHLKVEEVPLLGGTDLLVFGGAGKTAFYQGKRDFVRKDEGVTVQRGKESCVGQVSKATIPIYGTTGDRTSQSRFAGGALSPV